MKRLPRKYKKRVKKIVAAHNAIKITRSAMASAMGMVQIAMITSRVTPVFTPSPVVLAEKTLSAVVVAMDSAKAIQNIMSEPPNSWREFIR